MHNVKNHDSKSPSRHEVCRNETSFYKQGAFHRSFHPEASSASLFKVICGPSLCIKWLSPIVLAVSCGRFHHATAVIPPSFLSEALAKSRNSSHWNLEPRAMFRFNPAPIE